MAIVLTDAEYDEVRVLVGGNVDAVDLTDAQIGASTVLGAAESYVIGWIPGGMAGLNAAAQRGFRRAVLYRCAWILVPSFPEQVAEQAGQLSARYQGTPVAQRRRFLQEQAQVEIQRLVDGGHDMAQGVASGFLVFRPIDE